MTIVDILVILLIIVFVVFLVGGGRSGIPTFPNANILWIVLIVLAIIWLARRVF